MVPVPGDRREEVPPLLQRVLHRRNKHLGDARRLAELRARPRSVRQEHELTEIISHQQIFFSRAREVGHVDPLPFSHMLESKEIAGGILQAAQGLQRRIGGIHAGEKDRSQLAGGELRFGFCARVEIDVEVADRIHRHDIRELVAVHVGDRNRDRHREILDRAPGREHRQRGALAGQHPRRIHPVPQIFAAEAGLETRVGQHVLRSGRRSLGIDGPGSARKDAGEEEREKTHGVVYLLDTRAMSNQFSGINFPFKAGAADPRPRRRKHLPASAASRARSG